MTREVAVLGVGIHPWGHFPEKTHLEIGAEATLKALKDASVGWKDLQAIACACWTWGGNPELRTGNQLAATLGETGVPIFNVTNACATSGATIRLATMMIQNGDCDIALAVGLDKAPGKGFFPATGSESSPVNLRWLIPGAPNPVYWSLECVRRMKEYGTTDRDLAMAKALVSKYGALNPNARFQREYTVEEVLKSPMVTYPLRLLEICATSDGSAAAVLCSMDFARKHTAHPISLAAVSLASGSWGDPTIRIPEISATARPHAPLLSESVNAAKGAFKAAGIGPEDVDVVELADNSSWHYLQYLETIGFCRPGEAEIWLREGKTAIGSKLPVCPSGGFASFGEAAAAQGLAQLYELTMQLRGQCGPRQVEGAKIAFGEVYGAQGNNCAVVLKK